MGRGKYHRGFFIRYKIPIITYPHWLYLWQGIAVPNDYLEILEYSMLLICDCNILLSQKLGNRMFQEEALRKPFADSTYKEWGYLYIEVVDFWLKERITIYLYIYLYTIW